MPTHPESLSRTQFHKFIWTVQIIYSFVWVIIIIPIFIIIIIKEINKKLTYIPAESQKHID